MWFFFSLQKLYVTVKTNWKCYIFSRKQNKQLYRKIVPWITWMNLEFFFHWRWIYVKHFGKQRKWFNVNENCKPLFKTKYHRCYISDPSLWCTSGKKTCASLFLCSFLILNALVCQICWKLGGLTQPKGLDVPGWQRSCTRNAVKCDPNDYFTARINIYTSILSINIFINSFKSVRTSKQLENNN